MTSTLRRVIPLLFISALLFAGTETGNGQIVHVWDLRQYDQAHQMTFFNPDDNDAEFGVPLSSADLNGDGYAEYVQSAMAGDGPPGDLRSNAGEIRIFFSGGVIGGQVDFRSDHPRVVTLYGEAANDIFGIKHASGDIDGDGLNDLMVGAFYADVPGRENAGKLYIFSGPRLADLLQGSRALDVAAPLPPGVRVIEGPDGRSRLGVWMAAGDINGDGFDDVVVGADQGHSLDGRFQETGRVYVFYGPLAPDARIDAADTTVNMTVIYGIDAGDHIGSCLTTGDVNGDGYDDVIIGAGALGTLRNVYDRNGGAADGPGERRVNAGEVYVVFGKPAPPRHIDLRDNPPDDMVTIYGGHTPLTSQGYSPDRLGEEIIIADVNGDGVADLLIGAYRADSVNNLRRDAGEVYIVYGSPTLPGRIIDMEEAPSDVTIIYGARPGAITGDSVAAGDIHGDGYDDLFIGVPGDFGPLNRSSAGGIVVIAGRPDLPSVIDLANPSVPMIWVEGADPSDFSAYWSASGDFDGDGRIDAMPNGMHGEGPDNNRDNSGEGYILSGAELARLLPAPTFEDTVTVFIPEYPVLSQNFPNPFNASTRIPYALSGDRSGRVILRIFDITGRHIRLLVDATQEPGPHSVFWDGKDDKGNMVSSGVYFYELSAVGRRARKKLILIR